MKKRQATNKISFLVSLLLLIQVLFPAANVFATETNNNMLPPSNFTYQLLNPTDVKLTWSTVFGATGYKVYEITDGQLIARGTSATNTFTINSLSEGSYTYVVSTLSPDGESGPCAPITVNITYPDMTAPVLSYTIQNGNDIVLNWTASPSAQSYNLYQIQADGQTTLVKTQMTLTHTIANSSAGVYTYAVTASNTVYGESPLSGPVEVAVVYPTMKAPGNFTFTITNVNDVNLKWDAVGYAKNYNVYQIIDDQKVLISTLSGKSVTFMSQPAGDYVYEVYSYSDRFGESPEGSQVTVTVGSVSMAAPGNLTLKLQNVNDIVLTWSAVAYATSYKIYQNIDGEKELKSTVTGTTVSYSNQPAGEYVYEVHSYSDRFGESAESSQAVLNLSAVIMSPPDNVTSKLQNLNDIVLTWGTAANANSYKVYQIIDSQKVLKSTITGTTVTFTNQPAGDYVYEVHSFSNRFGESPEGSQITITLGEVIMEPPISLTYKVQNLNDIILTWGTAANANSYKVYQIIDGQKVFKSTVTGTAVTFTNQPAGDYVYEVHSFSTRFGESPKGSQITFTLGEVIMEPPIGFTYKVQNLNDVVLTWGTAANANSYKVYQIIDGQKVLKSTVTGTTVTFTNQPTGEYVYEVHSFSTRFGESPEGSRITFTLSEVIMEPPISFTYKVQNLNDVVLTWGTAANANSYKVYQIIDGQKVLKSTVTGTTVTFINQPAGDYIYEVHSFSTRFGESPESIQVIFTLDAVIIAAPENIEYQLLKGNDIVLAWDTAVNANTYKIYQITNGQKVLKSTVTGTTITYANQPEGNYTYEIYSFSTRFGESQEGSQVTFKLLHPIMEPPANLVQTVKNATDFTLTWDASTYATSYKVYQIVDGQKILKSTLTGLAITYTGMSPGEYTYEVYSVSTRFGESPTGTQLIMVLNGQIMQAPMNPTYSIAKGNDITLKWEAVTYATSYKIYQVVDGEKVLKSTIPGTTVTYTNQPEGSLNYEIHSVSTILGESPEGAEITATLVHPIVAAPGNFTHKIQNGNDVVLTWGAVTYGNSYKIYELIDGQKILKNTVTTLTVTQSNITGGEHTYFVHAVSNRFGESPEGSQVNFTLNSPTMQAPGDFTKSITKGNDITLEWDAVTYATAYRLYQVVNGQEVLVKSQTARTITLTNQPEGEYTYIVRSYSDRFGESPEGGELNIPLVWPIMQAPGGFTKTVTNGDDITFKWSAVTYASGYNLYQVIDGQEVLKKTQTGLTVTFTNQPEGDYTYVVRSYSTRFGESPAGSELQFTFIWPEMQAPGTLTKTIANGNDFTLKWNAVTYATNYRVYQVIDGQKVLKSTVTGTTVTYINMPAGDYSYEVHSYSNRFGESPIASILEFSLVWPVVQAPVLTGSVFNANNITLSWPAVTWANEYRVYDLTGGTRQLIYKGTALSFKVYNLSEEMHSYEVTTYNSRFGESLPSNRVSETIVFPVMQPPVASVNLLSTTSARISWNFVTYANGYNVYELIDGNPILLTENLNNLSYTITDMSYKNHEYFVTSYSNSFGESDPSNTVLAKLIVDTEAPVTRANAPVNWKNESQIVTLTATDNETGVENTFYSLNDGELTAGTTVKVDKEGVNKVSFYSVDKVGNTEAAQTISVKIDQTSPMTKVSEVPEWLVQTTLLQLIATDAHSGIDKTYYSVNGSEYAEGNSITVDDEGVYEVSFYSVDQAGNKETVQMVKVKLDRADPLTSSNVLEAWSTEKVDVILAATDTLSGVAKTYYSINGSNYIEGTFFSIDQEGVNKISFYSVDQAGNKETVQTIEVKLDWTMPITVSEAPVTWVKEAIVHLIATDAHSGVDKTYYSVNGSEYAEGNSIAIDNEGINKISFYSVDQAGNKETVQIVEVKLDRTAPITTSNAPLTWSKDAVTVLLTAVDSYSGAAKTFYSINGSEYREGSSFSVSNEGIHKVAFYSIDTAGNSETPNTALVKIDKTAPVITMNLNEEYKIGTSLQLTYSAIDQHSGILTEEMTITLPNGVTIEAKQDSSIVLDKPGIYTVTVTVTDGAGFSTTLKKQFAVYLQASITVTPNVIKGNKGVFTVRVDLTNGYSTQGFDLNTATINGVKALNSNNGYYNQAKQGQFKFERSDFAWTAPEATLHFRGFINGILVVGVTTVKVQN